MANTSYLRSAVEPWVRAQLADRLAVEFEPKRLRLAPGGLHEFDAVSADGRIVASIKANSGLTSGGKHPTGKVATCLNEIYFLSLVVADRRLLVLTNPAFHAIFTKATAGKIADGVGVMLIELPPPMQAMVDGVTALASQEMSRDESIAAAAVQAEEAAELGGDIDGS